MDWYLLASIFVNIWKVGKNITKKLSGKYTQRVLYTTKVEATDALKTVSKKAIKRNLKLLASHRKYNCR